MTVDEMSKVLDAMEDYVAAYREEADAETKALCILMLVGSRGSTDKPQQRGSFPANDAYLTVVVPENDTFGLNRVVVQSATGSQQAEILLSHPFAHVEDKQFNPIRTTSTAQDNLFASDLFEDKTGERLV